MRRNWLSISHAVSKLLPSPIQNLLHVSMHHASIRVQDNPWKSTNESRSKKSLNKISKRLCQHFATEYTLMVREIVNMHIKVCLIICHPRKKSTVNYDLLSVQLSVTKQITCLFALLCIHDIDSSYLGERKTIARKQFPLHTFNWKCQLPNR